MKSQSVRSTPFGKLFTLLLCATMAFTGCVTAESESDPEDIDEAEQELGDEVDADLDADVDLEVHQRTYVEHTLIEAEVFEAVDAEDIGPFDKAAPGKPGQEREDPDPHPWSDRKTSNDDDDNPVYAHSAAL